MSRAQSAWLPTGSTDSPTILTPLRSKSGLILAMYPSSVVQTGVKSFGWEHSTAHDSPLQSWKRIGPSVVCVTIRVTLVGRTQPAPAFGTATWRGTCRTRRWKTTIASRQAFAPGAARACAFGVEKTGGTAVDALLWCQTIKLVLP